MAQAGQEKELTIGALVLGSALTLIFTAANVFLGLKVGLTFSTSIPAAVISMVALKALKQSGILQNNIVQTVASAAGTLSSIIFVLPGLIMVGWWADFPFWQSALICMTGGLLGVMFSIPLRRALVTGSDLPFPEGCAAAEVLKVGSDDGAEGSDDGAEGSDDGAEGSAQESKAGLIALLTGSAVSGFYALLTAMRVAAADAAGWFRVGPTATGIDYGLSFALMGVGHLVGLSVGAAMLLGLFVGFGAATPILVWLHHAADPAAIAEATWAHEVRFIGAGVIGVAALWTLGQLVLPIARGLREAIASSKARKGGGTTLPIEERDMPVPIVGAITGALLVPTAGLLLHFTGTGPLAALSWPLAIGGTLYIYIASVIVASVCGYMAGLIGASNSPLSGVGILAILGAAILLALVVEPFVPASASAQMVAFALFATAIIFSAATIANDNLQDLKTGQLVGATPWKQQVALMVGVVAGSITIPLVLNLLAKAYGFGEISAAHPKPLPAPQAVLISDLAKGVLTHDLDWSLIGIGAALGLGLIALDGLMGRLGKLRLPPLGVGIGIYLPMSATLPVIVGAFIGHWWEKKNPSPATQRIGVLMASGLIVGESLFGVALAVPISITLNPTPLAIVGDSFDPIAMIVGSILFAGLLWFSYVRATRLGSRIP
ncbi:oligopeptide transporter, OPT family [Sphingomonas sp. CGMCC 1.13654]|uniref:Oligopeptide transporter, OPT family n=1 Tax=Sphingomonas chungangi TaxID=2683589 RepID=A0A838L977_9SPHN|nr:oligopeptide transporter, OPT family [Sphingomonas chungangi]MBA2934078.1 oligopeptide transporter, OPT family [Sphingomonas chungangi]MVW57119.1 oligopeptide transporter, OPT family [Sphingomonas chungangi]